MNRTNTREVEDRHLRYTRICNWARRRYADPNTGRLTLSRGGVPSRYSRIENLAAVKVIGLSDRYGARQ